jgi:tetratricopeptide (TPR) repeat protein
MAKLAQMPAMDRSDGNADVSRVPRLRTRYYAFLSYSHKDKEIADWLHRELEKFRVPHSLAGKLTANGVVPRRLTPIFRDQHDLSAGGDLAEEIKAALAVSQFLVILCSPTAAISRWTNAEIESFKRTRPEGCVLAAVVAGEPFASDIPGREEEECFPPALRYKYDRRGHQTAKRADPLAADFRDRGEGRRLAFLKLVAGMLGVGLDELVKREATRRNRHLAWLAAGSLAGMAVTSTLAVAAFEARNEAREQRREAESLIGFMLGDLKEKLEPIGKLDALDGVGGRVLAYYQKQETADLSDEALLQRSKALSLTAQVAFVRGRQDDSERLYREAMAGTAEAIRRKPDDPQRLFDHAQNVFWMGEIARKRGQMDKAEAAYREYKRLADRMVALEPDNLTWRMEVQYAREDLGIALMSQRRFPEAARQFEDSLRPMESLASIDPSKTEYQRELANAFGWLAEANRAMGRLNDAVALRRRQIAFLERVVGAGSTDVEFRQQLIPAHQALGVLLTSRGEREQGVDEYRVALAFAGGLLAVEPNNSSWRDLAANVRLELAKNLLSLGRADEAAQEIAEGCSAAADLHTRDPNVARWRTLQTMCLSDRSRLALASGGNSQALDLAQQAVNAARAEHSGDAVQDRYVVAAAYRLLGDVRARLGNLQGARAAWSEGIAQLPTKITERPWEMNEHTQLLMRLRRTNEAQPLVQRLATLGYQSVT